jgi:hypothetical protein
MVTLVLGPNDNPPALGRFTSGLDRVAQHHATRLDHHLLTAEGDTIHPRQWKVGKANITYQHAKGSAQIHLKRKWVQEHHHLFDRFIFHGNSSTMLKELCKLGRGPDIEAWLHCPDVMSTWAVNFNSGVGMVKGHGGRVIAVSERLRARWDWWHRYQIGREKAGRSIVRNDLTNLSVLHDPFVDEVRFPMESACTDEVKPATLPGCVLARLAPEKQIERAFGNGLNFIVSKTARNYQPDLSQESVVLDAPYEECMAALAESAFLVSTWEDETYGINALEAAERGVPVILCESPKVNTRWGFQPHASRAFLPEWAYITCQPSADGVRTAIASMPREWMTLAFRQGLAAHMRNL